MLEIGASVWLGSGFERGRREGNAWGIVGQRNGDGWVIGRGRGGVFSPVFRYRIEINRRFPYARGKWRRRHGACARARGFVAWGWGVNNGERFSDRLEERCPAARS
ncbi:MAG: hypothetical protein R3E96_15175 [Planctomycetota bacterium]